MILVLENNKTKEEKKKKYTEFGQNILKFRDISS